MSFELWLLAALAAPTAVAVVTCRLCFRAGKAITA